MSGVEHIPGICGGRAVIAGTRMPVWCLARLTDEQAREHYPHLTAGQLEAARAYIRGHIQEIECAIAEEDG